MFENKKTAIYFHWPENRNGNGLDYSDISAYAGKMQGVSVIWNSSDIPLNDIQGFSEKIRAKEIKRLILAGDQPGLYKNFFTKAMVMASNDPADVKLCSFNEINATKREDTELAKALLAAVAHDIDFEKALPAPEYSVNPDTLVIGGGIAGIQASLEIADSGNKVFLLEKTGTIGGHMATFDKTFPTLDCAACILTPKMVEIGQHDDINLLTYCEVLSVSGVPGDYHVKILKKARRVDLATCIGCGNCTAKCPSVIESEFDYGTTTRKAIYIPFPQAVPNKYLIDAEHCRWVQEKKCGVCVKACPVVNCINLDEKDTEIEIKVGNIIVAAGFRAFDAKKIEVFGYGKYPNVLTSLEFERLVNASGPTGGKIKLRSQDKKGRWGFSPDSEEPKSIALIHCIGSRDIHYNKYCSRVCCMYSLKLAHLVHEKLPNASVYEYYIDMRAFGKGYEEFYKRIQHEGVQIIRGRTAKIEEKNGKLLLRTEDILRDDLIEQEVDMAILAVGMEAHEDTKKLSEMLGLKVSDEGWLVERNSNSDPVGTFTAGICIAGACQGPKDIPDTVAQASAAAAKVIQSIIKGKISAFDKKVNIAQVEANIKELSTL
ncbi:MAG: CoB--CoM heterodisulfide reductase iron-sulfur subunit A family protein [Bacteroidales bacterium]|nr:CoB--CoM heterodisulfide reductase iron-sulfur subunit A family protein [Bacteroidales bacterium]